MKADNALIAAVYTHFNKVGVEAVQIVINTIFLHVCYQYTIRPCVFYLQPERKSFKEMEFHAVCHRKKL